MNLKCLLILATLAVATTLTLAKQFGPQDVRPRIRERFDVNWRFHEDPFPNLTPGPFSWQWRPADATNLNVESLPDDLSTGDWRPVKIATDVFHGRIGFAWYQTELGNDPKHNHGVLHFESVDDNGAVFLNGRKLRTHEGWNEPFDVDLSNAWNANGPNDLVVLVQNTDGPWGIEGKVDFAPPPRPNNFPREASPNFDDSSWRTVHLPHDYVVEGKFNPDADTGHGSLPVTTAWYRKTFEMPARYKGRSIWIDFDGVYRDSTVYFNGHKLGEWPSGYIGFRYDLTPYANCGGGNVLAVHVDATKQEGWWYEGGGIYRHVWLNVADPLHVAPWGTFVQAKVLGPEGQQSPASDLTIETDVRNDTDEPKNCIVVSSIGVPRGAFVGSVATHQLVEAKSEAKVSQHVHLNNSTLWSVESPALYKLETLIEEAGKPVDHLETMFGIRTVRFDPNTGFYLNGKHVEIQGTCNHQDHAGVGIAIPDSLFAFRVSKLKEMGSNAYRCSHNPPANELLDECDRQGMLVMDETRHLGDTELAKTPSGTGYSDLSELKSMILRDRNHPSIIMWSMCNEEFGLQATEEGARIFSARRQATLALDPTRPVTCAMNGGQGSGISMVEDLVGFNYGIGSYDTFHAKYPDKSCFGSETASTVGTRGIYENEPDKGYVSAYDNNNPSWGATAETAWSAIADRPWMAGSFAWTGFDYKGEPTPYGWPCINSHFGILDICGFPKDNFYYYQSVWTSKPMVHILPHWNWAGKEGQPIDVWAYSNADSVELFLNGKSFGVQKVPHLGHAEWHATYEPGTLEAKAYDTGGQTIATDTVETTGTPAAIKLVGAPMLMLADGENVSEIEVDIVDSHGRIVPTADNLVHFEVTGEGRVDGVGNGDPSSHEPDKASERHAFNGRCMVLLEATNKSGQIQLTALSSGLQPAHIDTYSVSELSYAPLPGKG